MEFDRFPQPITNIYWNPNCPLTKRKKKKMSRRKWIILQTNSKLVYAYIYCYHFIFCANEGAAKTISRVFLPLLFSAMWAPLPMAYKFISWAADGLSSVSPLLTGGGDSDHGQRKGSSQGRPERGPPASTAAPSFPCIRKALWQVRKWEIDAFIFGSLQF